MKNKPSMIVVDIDGTLYPQNLTDHLKKKANYFPANILIHLATIIERRMLPGLKNLRFLWINFMPTNHLTEILESIKSTYKIDKKLQMIGKYADRILLLSAQSEHTIYMLKPKESQYLAIGTTLRRSALIKTEIYNNKYQIFEQMSQKYSIKLTIGDSINDKYKDTSFIRVNWNENHNSDICTLESNIRKILQEL